MGTVFGKNATSSSITVAGHKTYYIDSTDAEIVEVQDGNNVKYNAFKYTLSGTPYWYIIDGEHDTWTDDLSAWGYSEVPVGPVLPTVTDQEWFTFSAGQLVNIGPGVVNALPLYLWGSSTAGTYDSGCSYAVSQWNSSSGVKGGTVELSVIDYNSGGVLGGQNDTQNTLSVWSIHVYKCSDSSATVITVYDSSNNAYNAFKYTTNNTDYYYILDGTQTDWTDDLGSIGYSLYGAEFDINTNWGTAVSIPSGYSVQSVKASRAYAFAVAEEYSVNYLKFHITGKDVYCTDTDTSLLGCGVDPVIGLFQITIINSQDSYLGYHITYRSSQTAAQAAHTIDYPSLNSGGNFVQLTAVDNTDNVLYDSIRPAMDGGKPLIIRKYDSSGNLVSYYMNVPQSLWSFQNGVFSWLGDSTSQSDMAYFYYNLQVRIHCVRT